MKSVVKFGVSCLVLCMIGCGGSGKVESEAKTDKSESKTDRAKPTSSSTDKIVGSWNVVSSDDPKKLEWFVDNPHADFTQEFATTGLMVFREDGTYSFSLSDLNWRTVMGNWKLVNEGVMKLVLENRGNSLSLKVTWIGKDECTLEAEVKLYFSNIEFVQWFHCHRTKGIEDYTEAIRIDPNDKEAYIKRAELWERLDNSHKAIEDYTEAIRSDPKNTDYYVSRGKVRERLGKIDKAIEDYTEAIRIDPNDENAWSAMGLSSLRNIPDARLSPSNLKRAVETFTEALRIAPNCAIGYYYRAKLRARHSEHDKAIEDFTEAIRSDPKNADYYMDRGKTWTASGEYDKAIEDYTEAIEYDKAIEDYTEAIEYDKAIEDDTEAWANFNPDWAVLRSKAKQGYHNRGNAWSAKGEFDKAIEDYTEVIRINPSVLIYKERGRAWEKKGDKAKAQADFEAAKRLRADWRMRER